MPGPRRRAMSHGNGVMLDVGMGSFQRHDPALESTVVRLWPRGLLWTRGPVEARGCKFGIIARMTRGKQKIEAQKRSAERNEKPKGSQIEARNAGLKTVCSVCKAPLANHKQLVDHFASKHPKETVPPGPSS